MLPFIIREKIIFLIQVQTFELPLLGLILKWVDLIPVVIGQGREALDRAMERSSQGHVVAFFPEGRPILGNEV